jgi:hypothetical protein
MLIVEFATLSNNMPSSQLAISKLVRVIFFLPIATTPFVVLFKQEIKFLFPSKIISSALI